MEKEYSKKTLPLFSHTTAAFGGHSHFLDDTFLTSGSVEGGAADQVAEDRRGHA
jgi:hypothetical protein